MTRVLEARILPPYEGQDGLGSNNSPGLSRIATAEFTAQYPLAHLQFKDPSLPVKIELDAFSPFIPHDPDASGLPVAILRYRVSNPAASSANVAISFSIDNPVKAPTSTDVARATEDPRVNEYQHGEPAGRSADDQPQRERRRPDAGQLCPRGDFRSRRRGPRIGGAGREAVGGIRRCCFGMPFRKMGHCCNEPAARNAVGALCQQKSIPAGGSANSLSC